MKNELYLKVFEQQVHSLIMALEIDSCAQFYKEIIHTKVKYKIKKYEQYCTKYGSNFKLAHQILRA